MSPIEPAENKPDSTARGDVSLTIDANLQNDARNIRSHRVADGVDAVEPRWFESPPVEN